MELCPTNFLLVAILGCEGTQILWGAVPLRQAAFIAGWIYLWYLGCIGTLLIPQNPFPPTAQVSRLSDNPLENGVRNGYAEVAALLGEDP